MSANEERSFASLPVELSLRFFRHLRAPDVFRASQTCKEWSKIASAEIRQRARIEIPVTDNDRQGNQPHASRLLRRGGDDEADCRPATKHLISWIVLGCPQLRILVIERIIDPNSLHLILTECHCLNHLEINISSKAMLNPEEHKIMNFASANLKTLMLTIRGDKLDFELNEMMSVYWSIVLPATCTIASIHVEQGRKRYPLIGDWIDFDVKSLNVLLPDMIALEQPRWPEQIFDELRLEQVLSLKYLRVEYGDEVFDSDGFEHLLDLCPDLRALILGSDVRVSDGILQALSLRCRKLEIAWLVDSDPVDSFDPRSLHTLYQSLKKPDKELQHFVIVTEYRRIKSFSQIAAFTYKDRQKQVKIPAEFSLTHPFMQRFLQFGT